VSHSTLQRLVHRQEFEEPTALQGVSEVSIDGGSASVLKSRVWKVIGGTTKPFAYRVFIMVHFSNQLVFETGLIVNFFVPLFVWAMVMMEYGICLKKLAALLLDRKF